MPFLLPDTKDRTMCSMISGPWRPWFYPGRPWFYPGSSLVLSSHVQRRRGLSQLYQGPHLRHSARSSEEAKKGVLGVLFSENKVLEI